MTYTSKTIKQKSKSKTQPKPKPQPKPKETKPKESKPKEDINENLKFEIEGDNSVKLWGISSYMTKTPYTKGSNSRPATEEEIKANKTYIPKRYFAYVIKEGKPILLIENKDQRKKANGQIEVSPAYFKPANIKWRIGERKFTHYDRNTNLPFLCITSKNPNIKPSSVKPNTMFHVKDNGWVICEKFDIDKETIVWNKNERYPNSW